MKKNKQRELITMRNHNGTILYQGFCYVICAAEKRLYETQTGNKTTVEFEKVNANEKSS